MLRIPYLLAVAAIVTPLFAQEAIVVLPIKDAVKLNDMFKAPEAPKTVETPKTVEAPKAEVEAVKTPEIAKTVEVETVKVNTAKIIAPGMNKQEVARKLANPTVETTQISTDGTITITFDRAEIMPVPKGIATIILGNPMIADAAVQPNGFMVITAKGNGTTNMIALDSKGNTMFNRLIRVRAQSEQVVRVYRGDSRETLTCAPNCTRTPTVGDAPEMFDAALAQSVSRSGILSTAGRSAERP